MPNASVRPLGLVTCWPDSVQVGSGTAVAQQGLSNALARRHLPHRVVQTSQFAQTWTGLAQRWTRNLALARQLGAFGAVLGVDGEGWRWARQRRRVPYVAVCKGVLADVAPFERGRIATFLRIQAGWERASARHGDLVVAASQYAAERLQALYGVPAERIRIVPEPFDFHRWLASLPTVGRGPLVLAVGHAYPRKNYASLIAAWPLVTARRPKARLVLVGTGPEAAYLADLAARDASVTVRGHIPLTELQGLYARASVFCHPSLQENFGIAVVEGLASGLSVVTHTQPAVMETLRDVAGAWSVDTRLPAALADALVEALDAGPWSSDRLEGLTERLAPARVGEQVAALLRDVGWRGGR